MSHESRFQELKLELPPSQRPVAVYKPIVVVDRYAFLSGHGPLRGDGTGIAGRLGEDLDKQAGYEAARLTGIAMLATLRQHLGTLDKVRRLVKTTGFVNATPEFKDHPAVINGFSELMREVFGPEAGVGARSAIGMASLPMGWAVEIEAVFEVERS